MKPAFVLHSPDTLTDYSIFIEEPSATEPGPWPAIAFLDGDDQFTAAVSAYHSARKAGELPAPLLLVGVGYGASYSKPANKRGRDYTQSTHSDEPTSGGAEAFTRFLTNTLWPELARRYPLRDDQRGIAGHSLGSLLVLYTLWRDPPFFTHYLASAPSIWWDDRHILTFAAQRHVQNATLPARLYLSVGEEDSASMTGDLTLLEQQLKARPFSQLDLTTRRFPRRNHFNVLPDAFHSGLVTLFGSRPRVHA
ncbi:esterase [Nibricoccus aquaticus]|uniref:Esterase n=1 Tax=Nibricoccus aquaticus TaxID=2576891 RepID=A0A290Q341_9BACT|nr:alpha/beta hydrolase-fold protein [Nibricoccus aquaticus]ATC62944.1 esterase [Nibricoccus aquaticus]